MLQSLFADQPFLRDHFSACPALTGLPTDRDDDHNTSQIGNRYSLFTTQYIINLLSTTYLPLGSNKKIK